MAIHQVKSALARAREMFQRRRIGRELDEELQLHLDLDIEYNIAHGMSPSEARRTAAMAFGGVRRFREETADARGFVAVERLIRELRFTVRRMGRAPTFAVGVIATLAIGLGASAGIGALVYGVMLRPLPYSEPDRLVRVAVSTPGLGMTTTENSEGTFLYFSERARSFAAVGGYYETDGVAITEGATPEQVKSAMVTPNIFAILGTRPALGRLFRDADALDDTVPVMISYEIWQRRFGGDSGIVGKRIELNRGRGRVIIGVLPQGFDFPSPSAAIYYPNAVATKRASLASRYITVLARLRPGVTTAAAEAELSSLVPHFHERFPELSAEAVRQTGFRVTVRTFRDAIVEPVRAELTLLAIMVGVVLLIATANVATLFLLRADRLRGEVAVSRALGASQSAVTQRFVVEGIVVALSGAVVALPIVALALSAKFGFTAGQIPRLHEVAMTGGVVAAMFAVAAVVGAVLGVAAVARIGTRPAVESLRAETRSTGSRGWRRAQQGLVALQMALALAMLLGAALTGESLRRLRRVDIGFSPAGASTFTAMLPFSGYSRYQLSAAFHFRVMESLEAIPGVTGVAAAMQLPLLAPSASTHQRLATDAGRGGTVEVTARANVVSANYFGLMGIPLRAGRTFMRGDHASATPGVILGASLAHELFGRVEAVGRDVRLADSPRYPTYRVIGVVGDVYGDRIPDGVMRVLYFPLLQDLPPASMEPPRIPYNPSVHYVVRSAAPLATLLPAFRGIVASIDARVPLTGVTTLDAVVSDATARARLTMVLLALAAAATLLLGAVGLYSVIAYAVAGRAPEFAVRLALGATAAEIIGLVFREGALVAATGLAVGLALSLGSARFIRGVLYEVSPTNPGMYVAAAGLLLLTALVAMYLPARRAGKTDPARVLRA